MKQLYTVTIEAEIIVLADSPEDAQEHAEDAIRPGGDLDESSFGCHAQPMKYLPADWDLTSIPFGDRDATDPDRTVGTWIEKGAAPEYKT